MAKKVEGFLWEWIDVKTFNKGAPGRPRFNVIMLDHICSSEINGLSNHIREIIKQNGVLADAASSPPE